MSEATVHLTIDGVEIEASKGELLVDAAKRAGIDIPIFCYHPKLEPAGMCRMCLVEIGTPQRDRATGEPVLDEDGKQVIRFSPKLETACTTRVSEGMVVHVGSEKAVEGRKQIIEFLLTSHPLDCPICDKGGECPLQNQTMLYGGGESRFLLEDKIRLEKHVPLGELIFLDRERCIQCGRCVRFQDELVDEPVLAFYQRGRHLEIVTHSEPGFDSYFSGNTTDICPVGALTTADFRFGARPWELNASASICTHCPVGCNLTLNTRREARAEGAQVIKRVLPRQNEAVNEIWICDKGRFAHHYAASAARVMRPLVRRNGELVETSWGEALDAAAEGLQAAGGGVVGLAGGRASNEDLFAFRQAVDAAGGEAVLADDLPGGEFVLRFGLSTGSDIGALGPGDAILVFASDLREEAPLWWLRVKNAAKRGAALIVAGVRPTPLEAFADHVLRYPIGAAPKTADSLLSGIAGKGEGEFAAAAEALADAKRIMVFYGGDGLTFDEGEALAGRCARILSESGHAGKPGSGLIAVWPHANTQGAWEIGLRPIANLEEKLQTAQAVYVMAADPVGDDPQLAGALDGKFVVVQELFLSDTAERADVVLPAQSFIEREGTFTSGERRVQRFYPAVPPMGEARPDWQIALSLAARLGREARAKTASAVFAQMAEQVAAYDGLHYSDLSQAKDEWPPVGGEDLYFGGTSHRNEQGLGVQLPSTDGKPVQIEVGAYRPGAHRDGLTLVPIHVLYDRGATVIPSELLAPRLAKLTLHLSPADAGDHQLQAGDEVEVQFEERKAVMPIVIDEGVPVGLALVGRSLGLPLSRPVPVEIRAVAERDKA